jgi:hypothetical protein
MVFILLISIISIDEKLMFPIQPQPCLIFFGLTNGVFEKQWLKVYPCFDPFSVGTVPDQCSFISTLL